MNLLNAFKSGGNPSSKAAAVSQGASSTAPSPAHTATNNPSGTHQASLLNLFRPPSVSQTPPATTNAGISLLNAVAPAAQQADRLKQRRPTLNEMTRSLPKPKAKTQPTAAQGGLYANFVRGSDMPGSLQPSEKAQQQAPDGQREWPTAQETGGPSQPQHLAKSKQLFDPNVPTPKRSAEQVGSVAPPVSATILARPQSAKASTSPKMKTPARSRGVNGTPKHSENGTPTAPITILARPGSAKTPRSPMQADATAVPTNAVTPKPFQPQLLRRPKPEEIPGKSSNAGGVGQQTTRQTDRRSDLLALFGKSDKAATQTPVSPSPGGIDAWNAAATKFPQQYREAATAQQQPSTQINAPAPVVKETFKKTSQDFGRLGGPRKFDKTEYTLHDDQGSKPVTAHEPMPVKQSLEDDKPGTTSGHKSDSVGLFSPQLASSSPMSPPSGRPQQERKQSQAEDQKNTLLNLFGRPSAVTTPTVLPSPSIFPPPPAKQPEAATQRSRMNSMASVVSNGALKGRGSGAGTPVMPVETKGFLLDFLNGVVQKEHNRGR